MECTNLPVLTSEKYKAHKYTAHCIYGQGKRQPSVSELLQRRLNSRCIDAVPPSTFLASGKVRYSKGSEAVHSTCKFRIYCGTTSGPTQNLSHQYM